MVASDAGVVVPAAHGSGLGDLMRVASLLRRSPAEYRFRLRQEFMNLLLLAVPPAPKLPAPPSPLPGLGAPPPPPEDADALAERIHAHRFPVLTLEAEMGREIRWRRDASSGIETGTEFFRRIPYLDAARAGDHKVIWEVNRHQHLVLLAQRGHPEDVDEIAAELTSWLAQNPWHRGINWCSALEVAFRALSWLWIWHLCGTRLPEALRGPLLTSLYRHGVHLEYNLSVYFSPNTHLLGEAVALFALGQLLPAWPRAERWRRLGSEWTLRQMETQVREDGSHFEQSSYYHVYALDFFRFYRDLGGETNSAFETKLQRMVSYLGALMGPAGRLFLVGDDDGGRFFHPYGDPTTYGRDVPGRRAPERSAVFKDAGMVIFRKGQRQVLFDAGPFGRGSAGHSHADTLQVLVRDGEEALLTDPGTYTYVADPAARDLFRGTAMHNTLLLDGCDQADADGPFRWGNVPRVHLRRFGEDVAEATCEMADGRKHTRELRWQGDDLLLILDSAAGARRAERWWHPGVPVRHAGELRWQLGDAAWLLLDGPAEVVESWRSRGLGHREKWPSLVSRHQADQPMAAAIYFGETCPYHGVERDGAEIRVLQ